jgi:uncharacterized glyoxalase superfamily protein PhnB
MAKAIPEGFHSLTPHITVSNAKQAIEFYQKAFGARLVRSSPGPDGRLMHAELQIGDSRLMLNDDFPEMRGGSPLEHGTRNVVLNLYVENADATFNQALAAGATTTFPLADQFWGDRYGQVQDPFGFTWAIATHVKDVTPEEVSKAAAAMFGG